MNLRKKLRILYDPKERFKFKRRHYMLNSMPDEEFLRLAFRYVRGLELNLENPTLFTEKLQWLKLYDRRPEYVRMVDKLAAKEYIRARIGGGYVPALLGAWERFDDIDFDALPDRFALKCTHDCKSVVLCTDKRSFNRAKARRKLERALRTPYAELSREWAYRNVKPRIIAEEYLDGGGHDLVDYKFHCFNGEPRVILVCQDRFNNYTSDFYSSDWTHLSARRAGRANAAEPVPKPKQLEEMLEISRKLSEGIPFVRVDFYIVGDRVYVGELTLYPAAGLKGFDPESFDKELGDMLTLPPAR